MVDRPRLSRLLRSRFEVRLTTVTGVGGFGKTTALALAMASNALDPYGEDVWLGIEPADSEAAHLIAGLSRSLGISPRSTAEASIEAISTAVLSRAPSEVCLILDDAHLLAADSTGRALVESLLTVLPANGHLVLSGRSQLPIPMARLRAHGQLLEITSDDLALDDIEAVALVDRHEALSSNPASIPRHAATADLQLSAGRQASTEFLWEEVLAGLAPNRLAALRKASILDELDDVAAAAISGGTLTSDEIVGDLPLVEVHDDGRRRLHTLLRDALAAQATPEETAEAAVAVAEAEIARANPGRAVQLFAKIGEVERALTASRSFLQLPSLRTPLESHLQVRRILSSIAPGLALTELAGEMCELGGLDHVDVDALVRIAESARAEGDSLVEAAALHRAMQGMALDQVDLSVSIVDRLDELAEMQPFARGIAAHYRSILAQSFGDAEQALAELENGHHYVGAAAELVMRAERLCDLGRPEQVGAGLTPDDLAELPPGGEVFIAFAMWLRGELLPEQSLSFASSMVGAGLTRNITHANVSILGVVTFVSLAAGEADLGRRRANHALDLCRGEVGLSTWVFGHFADVAATFATEGEPAAAVKLERVLRRLPMGNWPNRAYLMGLPLMYVLSPEVRPAIDRCSFGAALTTAQRAGQAIVALREEGRAEPAAALPWSDEAVLRSHVLPAHLVELAAGAASVGEERALELLERQPNRDDLVEVVASGPKSPAQEWAVGRLARLPAVPRHRVKVNALGPLEVFRDDDVVVDTGWRRGRVQELLAFLIEHRNTTRSAASAALWPDLEEAKVTNNMRVTLSHLQSVLEPERERSVAPYFVAVDGERLQLTSHVSVDVESFEALLTDSQEQDQAGAPLEAVGGYRRALEQYRGDYLDGIEADWVFASRLRFRSLAASAMCRVGELTLAQGEPEAAAPWAIRAQRCLPLNERAHRLFIASLLGSGDRAAALLAAQEFQTALVAAGLEPESETARAFERVGALSS